MVPDIAGEVRIGDNIAHFHRDEAPCPPADVLKFNPGNPLSSARAVTDKPSLICAKTVGWGGHPDRMRAGAVGEESG
jgi:hypothetical protein